MKDIYKIKEVAKRYGVEIYEEMPDGWGEIKGALTAPNGAIWIHNKKSILSKDYRHALLII